MSEERKKFRFGLRKKSRVFNPKYSDVEDANYREVPPDESRWEEEPRWSSEEFGPQPVEPRQQPVEEPKQRSEKGSEQQPSGEPKQRTEESRQQPKAGQPREESKRKFRLGGEWMDKVDRGAKSDQPRVWTEVVYIYKTEKNEFKCIRDFDLARYQEDVLGILTWPGYGTFREGTLISLRWMEGTEPSRYRVVNISHE